MITCLWLSLLAFACSLGFLIQAHCHCLEVLRVMAALIDRIEWRLQDLERLAYGLPAAEDERV